MEDSNKKGFLVDLSSNINEGEREINELKLLYKERKIPFKLLDSRIDEIFTYIKEDIKEFAL